MAIAIYFNEETQALTSALLVHGKRVFGIDGYPKKRIWHMHPPGKVAKHVTIAPMRVEQILEEYQKVVQQLY